MRIYNQQYRMGPPVGCLKKVPQLTMVYGRYNELVQEVIMVYKPTYNCRGPILYPILIYIYIYILEIFGDDHNLWKIMDSI